MRNQPSIEWVPLEFVRVQCTGKSPHEQQRILQEVAYLTGYPGVLAESARELANL